MTLTELLHFFETAGEKGLIKPNTAKSNKAVLMRLCSVLDQNEQEQLENIDADEIFKRFEKRHGDDLSQESLRVYKSRFISALETFLKHQEQGHFTAKNILPKPRRLFLPEIPIPMTDGCLVKLSGLPQDLSVEEAERIKQIIDAYTLTI